MEQIRALLHEHQAEPNTDSATSDISDIRRSLRRSGRHLHQQVAADSSEVTHDSETEQPMRSSLLRRLHRRGQRVQNFHDVDDLFQRLSEHLAERSTNSEFSDLGGSQNKFAAFDAAVDLLQDNDEEDEDEDEEEYEIEDGDKGKDKREDESDEIDDKDNGKDEDEDEDVDDIIDDISINTRASSRTHDNEETSAATSEKRRSTLDERREETEADHHHSEVHHGSILDDLEASIIDSPEYIDVSETLSQSTDASTIVIDVSDLASDTTPPSHREGTRHSRNRLRSPGTTRGTSSFLSFVKRVYHALNLI